MEELLFIFRLNLDPKSADFRKLGMAVLRKDVEALRAIERRQKGEPVETPKLPLVDAEPVSGGETIRAAFGGWKKSKNPWPMHFASSHTPSIASLSFMGTCRYRRLPGKRSESFVRRFSSCRSVA